MLGFISGAVGCQQIFSRVSQKEGSYCEFQVNKCLVYRYRVRLVWENSFFGGEDNVEMGTLFSFRIVVGNGLLFEELL